MQSVITTHAAETGYEDAPLPESKATTPLQIRRHGADAFSSYYGVARRAAMETQV
jgi:hypothetical protein